MDLVGGAAPVPHPGLESDPNYGALQTRQSRNDLPGARADRPGRPLFKAEQSNIVKQKRAGSEPARSQVAPERTGPVQLKIESER
jgi:hypothetical protein